jgi:hypothetical protein
MGSTGRTGGAAHSARDFVRNNVLGLVAIFIALSGTAYAIDGDLPGQNQVGSADIIDGEVQQADVAANAITNGKIVNNQVFSGDVRNDTFANGGLLAADLAPDSVGSSEVDGSLGAADLATDAVGQDEIAASGVGTPEIAPDAVTSPQVPLNGLTGSDVKDLTGADIIDASLTGSDVNESTLATVPNANEVDGLGARSFEFSGPDDVATTIVLNQGGLALKADCDAISGGGTRVELFADSAVNDSTLYAVDEPTGDPGDTTRDGDFDSAEANHQLIVGDASGDIEAGMGVVHFRGGPASSTDTTSDDVVTVQYTYEATVGPGDNCAVFGTAIGGPS